jgi:hypothetical protein
MTGDIMVINQKCQNGTLGNRGLNITVITLTNSTPPNKHSLSNKKIFSPIPPFHSIGGCPHPTEIKQ